MTDISEKVRRRLMLANNQQPCDKCNEQGWLWAHELDRYDGDNPSSDDTKYTCDRCSGKGWHTPMWEDDVDAWAIG